MAYPQLTDDEEENVESPTATTNSDWDYDNPDIDDIGYADFYYYVNNSNTNITIYVYTSDSGPHYETAAPGETIFSMGEAYEIKDGLISTLTSKTVREIQNNRSYYNYYYSITAKKNRHLVHLNSSIEGKTVTSDKILYGEVAVNYNAGNEMLQIKNSDNDIITFDRILDNFKQGYNTTSSLTSLPTDKHKILVNLENDNETLSLEDTLSVAFERYGELEVLILNATKTTLNFAISSEWVSFNGYKAEFPKNGQISMNITKIGNTYNVIWQFRDNHIYDLILGLSSTNFNIQINNSSMHSSNWDALFSDDYTIFQADLTDFDNYEEPLTSISFYKSTGLTSVEINDVDTSNLNMLGSQFYTFLGEGNEHGLVYRGLFQNCYNLVDISGISGIDTSNVTSMTQTFDSCSGLTSLDALSGWNTSKVTSMNYTFSCCSGLTSLNGLSGWDTSNVTSMTQTFDSCSGLTSLDALSGWNTSKVTSMNYTFSCCSGLTSLNGLSGWDTSNVTSMIQTFGDCSGLTSLDALSGWDTSNVVYFGSKSRRTWGIFENCRNITTLHGLENWSLQSAIDLYGMFAVCKSITNVNAISGWDTSNVTSMSYLFGSCDNLTNVDGLSGWSMGNVTDVEYMFRYCYNLTNVDGLSGWSMGNVTDISSMFQECKGLTHIDALKSWDVSNVTWLGDMFYGCSSLMSVDLSNWDLARATSYGRMFYNCTSLTSVTATYCDDNTKEKILSGLNTSNIGTWVEDSGVLVKST